MVKGIAGEGAAAPGILGILQVLRHGQISRFDTALRLTDKAFQPFRLDPTAIGNHRLPLPVNYLRRMHASEMPLASFQFMEQRQHRFYCHIESNGTWGVWDRATNNPARLGAGDLLGCKPQRAEVARNILTRICGGARDTRAIPPRTT